MLNFQQDGMYIVKPEHTSIDQAEFTPRESPAMLKTLQEGVGGYIEHICLAEGGYESRPGGMFGTTFHPKGVEVSAWCNEEGKLKGLPFNSVATQLVSKHGFIQDMIVGNLIITCGKANEEDEDEAD